MRPRFRTDLQAAREEQQGVVFYRIDDPDTQTSFRLYEIEYLIARKLDGGRTLEQVIAAVKEEYNFDISAPDLRKFVSQLESMGFIKAADDEAETVTKVVGSQAGAAPAAVSPPAPPAGPPASATGARKPPPPPADASGAAAEAGDVLAVESAGFDDVKTRPFAAPGSNDEHKRLLVTAFDHLKQGYSVHARDYFLAAKESKPGDARIDQLVARLDAAGEAAQPNDIQEIWALARELFGELLQGIAPSDEELLAQMPRGDNLRARVLWLLLLLVVLGAGGGGIWYVLHSMHLLEGVAPVQVAVLQADTVAIFYPEPATSVRPASESWLTIGSPGKAVRSAVAGTRAAQGDILLSLGVPPPIEKRLEKMRADIDKAVAAADKAAKAHADLLAERDQVTAERDSAQAKLKQMKSDGIMSDPANKKDAENLKKELVKANKRLSQLAKKERSLAGAKKRAEGKRDGMQKRLAAAEQKLAPKLVKAPSAGRVIESKVATGGAVKKGQEVILFRDTSAVLLGFQVSDPGNRLAGGEAWVSVDGAKPTKGTITEVKAGAGGTLVEVKLPDESGAFSDMQLSAFRLVREEVASAFEIDAGALVPASEGEAVFVAADGRAARRPVDVLQKVGGKAVIRARDGNVKAGDQVVVGYPAEGGVTALDDDTAVEVVGQ